MINLYFVFYDNNCVFFVPTSYNYSNLLSRYILLGNWVSCLFTNLVHTKLIIIFVYIITDSDQPGPFSTVEYYVVDGPFSDYVAFENPLEGDMVLTKSLDYEAMRSISLQIEARDQGAPPMTNKALVTINVIGN